MAIPFFEQRFRFDSVGNSIIAAKVNSEAGGLGMLR
jgi:hypothetical protein